LKTEYGAPKPSPDIMTGADTMNCKRTGDGYIGITVKRSTTNDTTTLPPLYATIVMWHRVSNGETITRGISGLHTDYKGQYFMADGKRQYLRHFLEIA
jgi:hypothetical protein